MYFAIIQSLRVAVITRRCNFIIAIHRDLNYFRIIFPFWLFISLAHCPLSRRAEAMQRGPERIAETEVTLAATLNLESSKIEQLVRG